MRQTFYWMALLLISGLLGQTNAQSPSDQVQQLTAQLQKSPDDEALREKIIALALTLKAKPSTPDTAIMAEGAAEYACASPKGRTPAKSMTWRKA
jgi:hypothetical protein